jgi:undecaprenyl-diphosphatase
MTHLTYAEAIIVGLIQGVTELFPVSSLGHNVLLPAIIGGSWARDLDVSKPESPYLAFIVGLHVATAIALTAYFWRDWVRIIGGFFSSVRHLRIETPDQKLAWMIIFATIPVGLVGLVFEHTFRVLFAVPSRAAAFLVLNGIILFSAERFRTRKSREADQQVLADREKAPERELVGAAGMAGAPAGRGDQRDPGRPPDRCFRSRSGHPDRLGADPGPARRDQPGRRRDVGWHVARAVHGVLKVGDLLGPLGQGIRPQILVGSIISGIGAYVSVRFLMKYFRTRTLTPFAIYCVVAGALAWGYLVLIK